MLKRKNTCFHINSLDMSYVQLSFNLRRISLMKIDYNKYSSLTILATTGIIKATFGTTPISP